MQNLDEVRKLAQVCTKCPLCQTRNNVVFEDGNEKAKLMIVGEAPGEQEDKEGLPFVGRAGKLLDKILSSVNIDRKQDTYICNIIKCRPPNNRVPTEKESLACREYLIAQLNFVKPKILLLLGSTAVGNILQIKNIKITQMHGLWLKSEKEGLIGIDIMPFFHPSYLLRNPSSEHGKPKWQAWQAIKEVKAKLDVY